MSDKIYKPEQSVVVKHELRVSERFPLELPLGAEILSVLVDNNTPKLYVLSDPYQEVTTTVYFEIIPTGVVLPAGFSIKRKFIGSFQINNGNYTGHVFQRLN